MPLFTIETTYHLPVFRQRTYEAETLDAACALAVADAGRRQRLSAAIAKAEAILAGQPDPACEGGGL